MKTDLSKWFRVPSKADTNSSDVLTVNEYESACNGGFTKGQRCSSFLKKGQAVSPGIADAMYIKADL